MPNFVVIDEVLWNIIKKKKKNLMCFYRSQGVSIRARIRQKSRAEDKAPLGERCKEDVLLCAPDPENFLIWSLKWRLWCILRF